MSLRVKPTSSAAATTTVSTASSDSDEVESPVLLPPSPTPQPQSTLSQRALSQTLSSTAQLANLLPTGSLLALQLLTPVFTNNGSCDAATRPLTLLLLLLIAASCFLASFTDSYKASNGQVYYGFATFKGMWLFDYQAAAATGVPDLKRYKMGVIDWIHATSSVLVFVVLALRDKNVVTCFYPQPSHEAQEVLNIVPIGIGFICSLLFMVFPTRRHGIGYPVSHNN
ncbi:protein DMP3-like [Apium graveolens]|uniref:protein DMP3-like n=1 Tax=Apium graveolens TaxID=4045 RepID=UPI003D7ABBB0